MSPVAASLSADEYLREVLLREAIDTSAQSPLRAMEAEVAAFVRGFAGGALLEVYPTGSFERGTGNRTGRSIDFLCSFSPKLSDPIDTLYEGLFDLLDRHGYNPERRDVSIAFKLRNAIVDLVPARREAMGTDIHELWVVPAGRVVKTNPAQHIIDIVGSGRIEEIRVLKLWRDQIGLDFPSFYLELSVIAALRKRPHGTLADNVWAALGYLESLFSARSVLDPVNANNIVSDLTDAPTKDAIRKAAQFARGGRAWSEIIR